MPQPVESDGAEIWKKKKVQKCFLKYIKMCWNLVGTLLYSHDSAKCQFAYYVPLLHSTRGRPLTRDHVPAPLPITSPSSCLLGVPPPGAATSPWRERERDKRQLASQDECVLLLLLHDALPPPFSLASFPRWCGRRDFSKPTVDFDPRP